MSTIAKATSLKLYSSAGSANGQKATIMLSLLGLKYEYKHMKLSEREQKEAWFLKLNPLGKIPVLADVNEKGEEYVLPESCAILSYLGEKYDTERKFYYGADAGFLHWDQMRWLFFADSTSLPRLIQAYVFNLFTKEDLPELKKSTVDDLRYAWAILEDRVKQNNGWLVGDRLNIADIANYTIVLNSTRFGIELTKEFPILNKWVETIAAIPGLEEARAT